MTLPNLTHGWRVANSNSFEKMILGANSRHPSLMNAAKILDQMAQVVKVSLQILHNARTTHGFSRFLRLEP
jgi:hypothetical protein